jgi:hypothetical protein
MMMMMMMMMMVLLMDLSVDYLHVSSSCCGVSNFEQAHGFCMPHPHAQRSL